MRPVITFSILTAFVINVIYVPVYAATKNQQGKITDQAIESKWQEYKIKINDLENLNAKILSLEAVRISLRLIKKQINETTQKYEADSRAITFKDSGTEEMQQLIKKHEVMAHQLRIMKESLVETLTSNTEFSDENQMNKAYQDLLTEKQKKIQEIDNLKSEIVFSDDKFDKLANIYQRKQLVQRKLDNVNRLKIKISELNNNIYNNEAKMVVATFVFVISIGIMAFNADSWGGASGAKKYAVVWTLLIASAGVFFKYGYLGNKKLTDLVKSTSDDLAIAEKLYNQELMGLNDLFNRYENRLNLN